VERVRTAFPGDRVLAEEGSGTDHTTDGRAALWIIDPLDGTTNWLHGYPEYAVSIAALDAAGLRIGVVLNSVTGEAFTAVRGRGARRDGVPIEVSGVSELRLALLGTGFPFKRPAMIPDYLRVLGRTLQETSGVRRGGAASLDLCDVACGRLDAFWEHWLMPWDVAAGALVVLEAGGTFDALPGSPEPTLAAAAAEGLAIARVFATGGSTGADGEATGTGRTPIADRGAAFMAGNGRVDGAFRRLLTGALAGESDRG